MRQRASQQPDFRESNARHGVALLWALVTLAILATLTTVISSRVMESRHLADRRENQLQAVWLARAGQELAIARLLIDPAYKGEKAELIPASQVQIEIQKDPKAADTVLVKCEARFPESGPEMVKRSLERRWRRVAGKDGTRMEIVVAK